MANCKTSDFAVCGNKLRIIDQYANKKTNLFVSMFDEKLNFHVCTVGIL